MRRFFCAVDEPSARSLVRRLAHCWLFLLGLVAASPRADASAWNEPQGQGLVVVDYTFDGGSRYFNGEGHLTPASAYRKQELTGYLEYGVTDWLMAVIKPDLMSAKVGDPNPGHYTGLGTSEAGAQLRLLAFGPAVLSAAGSFRLPGTTKEDNPALIGDTSRDADARMLFGIAFAVGRWPAFLDVQGGYRIRSGGAPGEWHGDVTIGVRPMPRLLVLMQSFNSIPVGPGNAWFPRSEYSKFGVTFVYDLTTSWAVEVGMFQTVGGIDALRERGFKSGLWYRF